MIDNRRLLALIQAQRLSKLERDPDKVRYRVGQTYGCGWQNVPERDRELLDRFICAEVTRGETKRQQG